MYGGFEEDEGKAHGRSGAGKEPAGKGRSGPHPERIPFDARKLLADFASVEIACGSVQEVHLSERGPFAKDGYYKALQKATFQV
jgi:hypothetical protein